MRAAGVISALGLALALSGCVPDYVRQNDSPVLFRIVNVSGPGGVNSLQSDVATIGADTVFVTLAVRPKNPLNSNVPQIPEAVVVEQYRVRFFRTDGLGRDVEGVDVPFSFSGGLTTTVDIGTGGGANVTVAIPLIRAQAKLEPPLRNFRNLLTTTTGTNGTSVVPPRVTMTAEITIFGRTIAGEAVSDTGRITVDFVG
jgi:hypothetical protein